MLLALFSLLDAAEEISEHAGSKIKLPMRGIFQGLKLVATTLALIFTVAFLIGKSPVIPEFGLRLHQAPSGHDIQKAAERFTNCSGDMQKVEVS